MRRFKAAVSFLIVLAIVLVITKSKPSKSSVPSTSPLPTQQSQSSQAVITDPPNLDGAIITPNQNIKFTFKKPLAQQNFDVKIEPDAEHRIDFTPDRTGILVVPTKNWKFGQSYTLTILSDTKFQDGTSLGVDLRYHVKTIQYSGV